MDMVTRRTSGGILAACLVALAACTGAPPASAKTLEVGKGKTYAQPSAAIAAAQSGDTVSIEPGEYFDCAVVTKDRLTIVGTGDGATFTDKVCQGKGLLVTTGNDITLRNLILTRARVADHNGAGIRAEGTNLTIDNVRFLNNENGILTADNEDSTIRITNSLFDHNGKCEAACAHGIYAAHIKLLQVVNTRFINTHEGHSIKSRAAQTEITGSSITEGPDGDSSYLVEIPNGGGLTMTDDVLEKGANTQNHSAAIVIGAEGVTQRTPQLVFKNVSFANDYGGSVIFVRNLTATPAEITGAKFSGHKVVPLEGDGRAN